MTDIKTIIELAEHPELFTEEQMTELLADEENLKMYLTVSETMMAMEGSGAEAVAGGRKPVRLALWTAVASVAAAVVLSVVLFWPDAQQGESQGDAALAEVTGENAGSRLHYDDLDATMDEFGTIGENEGVRGAIIEMTTEIKATATVAQTARPRPRTKAVPVVENEVTDEEIEQLLRLQQARLDNELAMLEAEAILAMYYAQQRANLEQPSLPDVNVNMGDAEVVPPNIMTLIMQ